VSARVEIYRKRSVKVEMMLWDGTDAAVRDMKSWIGSSSFVAADEPGEHARLWVAHNSSWSLLPIGYRVAKELDGSGFYPLSPEGFEAGYEPTPEASA
jgi:hypothetical protein